VNYILNPPSIGEDFFLNAVKGVSLDCETYSLEFEGKPFAIQLSNGIEQIYFNLKTYDNCPWLKAMPLHEVEDILNQSFRHLKPDQYLFISNAVFDMQKMGLINVDMSVHNVWCTHAAQRLIKSDMQKVDLDSQAKYWGYEKDKGVEEYISKNKLYTVETKYGVAQKVLHYDRVPFDIMLNYGLTDAIITHSIGCDQVNATVGRPECKSVELFQNEMQLAKTLLKAHTTGIRLNTKFAEEQFDKHKQTYENLKAELFEIVGPFNVNVTSSQIEKLFEQYSLKKEYTLKKEFKTSDDVLSKYVDAFHVFEKILSLRFHCKMFRSFYYPMLYYKHRVGSIDILHPNLLQWRASTGRMSAINPAMQTIPARGEGKLVKRALIPRDGHLFLELDYKAMELRLAYDVAGERHMIKAINEGLDPHQKLADQLSVTRDVAKTFIFSFIYGASASRLALQTGLRVAEVKRVMQQMRIALPKTMLLKQKLEAQIGARGWLRTLSGRIIYLKRKDAYKAFNAFIQGSCADIVKRGLNQTMVSDLLRLTVHDSVLLEVPHGTSKLTQVFLCDMLANTHKPINGLSMEVSIKHSLDSYGQMIDGPYIS